MSAADVAARQAGVHVGMPAAKVQALFRGLMLVDAVFVRVEIDVELLQQDDGEASEDLGLTFQPVRGIFVVAGKNAPLQCHDGPDTTGSRLMPFEQSIMELSRDVGIAAEAVCQDDEPETGKLGVERKVLVRWHCVISFILMTETGHSVAKRGSRTAERGLQAGGTNFFGKRSATQRRKNWGDRAVLDAGFAGVNWDVRERRDPRSRRGRDRIRREPEGADPD
ncbi:hypothetical protein ATY75_32090 [Rhizobium sp. N122]|nr:hypothetical protein ATY75_32090 [Rhizobium sp. N122]